MTTHPRISIQSMRGVILAAAILAAAAAAFFAVTFATSFHPASPTASQHRPPTRLTVGTPPPAVQWCPLQPKPDASGVVHCQGDSFAP